MISPCTMPEEIERAAAAQSNGSNQSEPFIEVSERLLDAYGDEDDAADNRQMKTTVRFDRQSYLLIPARLGKSLPSGENNIIEVEPPQRDDEGKSEENRENDHRTAGKLFRPDASTDRHD